MSGLPVAGPAEIRRAARDLIRRDRRAVAAVLVLNALAAAAGLVGPWLLGRIVDEVRAGAGAATVDRLALVLLVFALLQILLLRAARRLGHRFGERTLARLGERYVERALRLPAAVVERAGTGDLAARGTGDISTVGVTLRDAGPDVLIATVQALFIVGAVVALDPRLGACALLGLVGGSLAVRWYLRRAHAAYLAEGAAYSALAEQLTATATGARTVEAFGLQRRRLAVCEAAVEESRRTRLRTLFLRSVLFPTVDVCYMVPVVGVLLMGGVLLDRNAISLGTVAAAALYLRQLVQPLDTLLLWVDQLQRGAAAFARVEGLGEASRDAGPAGAEHDAAGREPADDRLEVAGVRYAYGDGAGDVLHGVDLTVRPGERLAIVGPSGAGKSTLGRLLAGVDAPRAGRVTVGGVPVAGLPADRLRRQVVLVTQEHHVFLGTLRDNLLIAAEEASDAELVAALAAVGAEWVAELPNGLDTELGANGDGGTSQAPGAWERIDGARAQQLALARVVLADPHTVILDEATALLDPSTARHTERALAAVLRGRTVVAIAHRLHTAHDADRVAVLRDGRLTELGPHDELVTADGDYAALWRTWHGEARPEPAPAPDGRAAGDDG
ncbi:ABC transporter ATP-binding protein [Streptomyces sp. B6B3]|uniref:ABC transporter ATP-binding protein n=1 Tax=Streptomyces sp. B6B3 TaxID=3153570 RepID=UPI00325F740E